MAKKILILSGSPKRDGNTALLAGWFTDGAQAAGAKVETVRMADLKLRTNGCLSCRICQKKPEYTCIIDDDASKLFTRIPAFDAIVMATPLYFFSMSAQLKVVFDRFFSLYKWDNTANTFLSPLKGKTLALIASAYEDIGLDALEAPFRLTANYTEMKFVSLLIPNAGTSGEAKTRPGIREKAVEFGKRIADEIGR